MKTTQETINKILGTYCWTDEERKKKIAQTANKIAVLLDGMSRSDITMTLETLQKLTEYYYSLNLPSKTVAMDK